MKIPAIDLGTCTECEGCIEVCPSVFRKNPATGYIEVVDLENYPKEEVDEAIKNCPADSIHWE
ncbi:MAG: ferredoxin [Desulfobulbaceae bacterium]|nr:ferredoxin [Desulfobulbaceae bacterium]